MSQRGMGAAVTLRMRYANLHQLLRRASRTKNVISFAGGLPAPETFPREALAECSTRAMFELSEPLQYDWAEGRPGLRTLIAERLNARGANISASEVVITNGAQEALSLILQVLKPEAVEVDRATYPGALELMTAQACRLSVNQSEAVRYAMPSMHNPFGWSMSDDQRANLLNAKFVIEDDAYAELRFDGDVRPTLLKDSRSHVFHVGSFSKTLSPGLRVGYVVAPPQFIGRLREVKGDRDLHANGVCQAVVEHYLRTHDFDERLQTLRSFYQQRAERLLAVMPHMHGVRFWVPQGGFSVWLETELAMSDEEFLNRAIANGVSVDPGSLFRPKGSAETLAMRLSFSAVPMEQIGEGVDRLAATLERALHGREAVAA